MRILNCEYCENAVKKMHDGHAIYPLFLGGHWATDRRQRKPSVSSVVRFK